MSAKNCNMRINEIGREIEAMSSSNTEVQYPLISLLVSLEDLSNVILRDIYIPTTSLQ